VPNTLRLPPVLVRAEISTAPNSPQAPSEGSTGSGSSPGRSPKPNSLATLRDEQKAKKFEKIVQARAVMQRRLSDYCALQEQAQRGNAAA